MADQRAVDGALAQGVSAIESTYNDLQGHFRRLEGDLSTIGSSWQGSASVQFTQLMLSGRKTRRRLTRLFRTSRITCAPLIRRWKPTSRRPRTRSPTCSADCERLGRLGD